MPTIDPDLFSDVADALSIPTPAIVEKDYYVVQLLKELSELTIENYELIFAGGTCLSKAHINTFRMSEDIDIKLVPNAATAALSKNQQRNLRNDFERDIIRMIEASDVFTCESPTLKRNESRHQEYEVVYPRNHEEHSSLRPNILLQITEFPLLQTKLPKSIASMYAQVANLPHEVTSINCVSLASIAAEKVVAMLRRTALEESSPSRHHDDRLIRHVYDLHLMNEHLPEYQEMQDLIDEVIDMDIYQYGDKHPLLKENPRAELLRGLNILISNPIHRERYAQFLGPLVYHPHPATWEEVIENLQVIAQQYLSA